MQNSHPKALMDATLRIPPNRKWHTPGISYPVQCPMLPVWTHFQRFCEWSVTKESWTMHSAFADLHWFFWWRRSSFPQILSKDPLSKCELLRRERKRNVSIGIARYSSNKVSTVWTANEPSSVRSHSSPLWLGLVDWSQYIQKSPLPSMLEAVSSQVVLHLPRNLLDSWSERPAIATILSPPELGCPANR